MESDCSGLGSGNDEEIFSEDMFGELNKILDEIDSKAIVENTFKDDSEAESSDDELLENVSQNTSKVADKKIEIKQLIPEKPIMLINSSQNEFDEDLFEICESIEREDVINRSLKNSEERPEDFVKNLIDAEVLNKKNELGQLQKGNDCEAVANINDPHDQELPKVLSKETDGKNSETLEKVDTPKSLENSDEGDTAGSHDSVEDSNDSSENTKLTEEPIDSTLASDKNLNIKLDALSQLDKIQKNPAEELTEDGGELSNDKRLVTPEKIIDLLNKLSPEKLQVIKSQVFNKNPIVTEKSTEFKDLPHADKSDKMDVDESPNVETVNLKNREPPENKSNEVTKLMTKETVNVKNQEPPQINSNGRTKAMIEDCVILLDSDDEPDMANCNVEPIMAIESISSILKPLENDNSKRPDTSKGAIPKRKSDESKENQNQKVLKKSSECVNTDCPRDSDEFLEAHLFVLNFYYSGRKLNKFQYVCSTCFDKAVKKYEELGESLLNNKPIFEVPMHTKQDMVEIIDSDEEDEELNLLPLVPESEKIEFTREIELEIENILEGICNRIDLKKQLTWEQKDLENRSIKIDDDQLEFEKELKILEKKSSIMYNDLYSINKPRFQRRKSLDIVHEIEPRRQGETQMSLKSLLISKKRVASVPPPNAPAPDLKNQEPLMIKSPAVTSALTQVASPKIVISPSAASTAPRTFPPAKTHYAVRSHPNDRMQNWAPCKLVEVITTSSNSPKLYRVQFFDATTELNKIVKGNEVAKNQVDLKLKIGARIIAQLSRPAKMHRYNTKKFLPGVIGEKLSKYNNQRYLVFFDYGQVQYVSPTDVREILESSENVWEDVHINLRQFIYDYLQSQTMCQRALLNVRVQQQIQVERHGVWGIAIVTEIDCSVVKMRFIEDNSFEWIYRGSKRLGPLFNQGNRSQNMNARRNDPNISYITIDDDFDKSTPEQENEASQRSEKNTARKSTSGRIHSGRESISIGPLQRSGQPTVGSGQAAGNQQSVIILNDNNIYLEEPKKITKYRHFTPRPNIAAKKYVEHTCSQVCLKVPPPNLAHYSPLSKPLLTCWERLIVRQKNNRWVLYKAPCGRRLRDMFEIRIYLLTTKSTLNVDNFDFDVNIQVLHAYDVIDKNDCPLYIPDMSEGKEGMKIPVINAFDDTRPPKLEYSAHRIPMNGVKINTDPEFMACCDCTDDCADKTKCACFQMTIQGHNYAQREDDNPDEQVSYVWKRLTKVVSTGIYECHSRCKCTSRCLNKVVQQPIQIKMQLFRTKNRGWGLECCHDIPKGSFICIYAGRLYREDDANALCQGEDHGDEYFAELDLIETAQTRKEDFEPGVLYQDSDSEEENASDPDSDYDERKAEEDEEFTAPMKSNQGREIVTRSTRGEKRGSVNEGKSSNDSDSDDEMVNFEPTVGNDEGAQPKGTRSLRKLFGKNERVYIMDAKLCGNVGRYFNHSCDPNLAAQSVFVDTHDMRFPWIAFFATRAIKAGEELTWNYNYEVGSVPSKCMYCKCGAKNCRGRIL